MQYISFSATKIVTRDAANRLALESAFNHWAEAPKPTGILHARFYYDMKTDGWGFQGAHIEPKIEPTEEYSAVDQKDTGWKLVAAWTGAIVGSWALAIGCVAIARTLLP